MGTISENFALALAHHQAGRLHAAEPLYRQVLRADPDHFNAWHLLGFLAYQLGQLDLALETIAYAIRLNDRVAAFHHNLGDVQRALGRLPEAADSYRRALELPPALMESLNNLGLVLYEQGILDEAADCFGRALTLKPDDAEIHNNLGNTLFAQRRFPEAIASFHRSLALQPDSPETLTNLANTLKSQRNLDEALACLQKAIQLKPDYALAYNSLGHLDRLQGRLDDAVEHFRRALELKPDNGGAFNNLGNVLEKQEKLDEARACYQEYLRLNPQVPDRPFWLLRMAGLCPAVFDSVRSLEEYRQGLVKTLADMPPVNLDQHLKTLAESGAQAPFNLLYHGRGNRTLKETYARIFDYRGPVEGRRPAAARPQVGLVVTLDHEGIFLRFWEGMLERMRLERFDLVIVCAQEGAEKFRAVLRNDKVRLLPVPKRIDQAAAIIRAARFDVLYHWEVGTDATNYFLPFLRLAPVQCTSCAIQETSGIAQIDYYLSTDLLEPPGAAEHYTEKLLLGKTLLTHHPRPTMPPTLKPRAAFGLDSSRHLYVCAQNMRKFHPDFDPLLQGILQNDEKGTLVLVKDRVESLAEKLRQRFARTIPDVADRIVFLPWQNYPDYLSLVSAADVILDPLHYNGGTTNYEAMALGKPVVAWPGRFQISRAVLGFCRKMGIKGCIATSAEEYIKMAVALGTNPDYRETLQKEIVAAGGELFEDSAAVREHEEFFERLVEEAR